MHDQTLTWIVKSTGLVMVMGITAFLWPGTHKLILNYLSLKTTMPGWLALDGLLLGSGAGAAISSLALFIKNRHPVIAYICALLILLPPVAILMAVGSFNASFQLHP